MTYIIAEIGVNHNGKLSLAKKLILMAKKCGVNAVKFQSFVPEEVVIDRLSTAPYQKRNIRKKISMVEMIKKYYLSFNQQKILFNFSKKNKIDFISSPFDLKSAKFLIEKLKLKIIKIPSGEINNYPLLSFISNYKVKIILSTGMSTVKEIKQGISILTKKKIQKKNITLLHCHSQYPTNLKDVNLKSIVFLKKKFKTKIGFSDHCISNKASIASICLGASVIEKHITLDRKMNGPDHKASLDEKGLKGLINGINKMEVILGKFNKKPSINEKENIYFSRKSIVAKKKILKGQTFTTNNIATKRPAGGISPMKWKVVLGRKAKKNFKVDDYIYL